MRQEALRHLPPPVNGAIAAGAVAVHIDAEGAGRAFSVAAAIVGGAAHGHLPHPAISLRDRQTKRGEGRKLVLSWVASAGVWYKLRAASA